MKKCTILIILFIGIILMGFVIGLFIHGAENVENEVKEVAEIANNKNTEKEEVKATDSKEEKISINTKIVQKTYYTECNHIEQEEIKNKEKYINKTKSEMQIEFVGWIIEKFTTYEVVLYKEIYDFCGQHYLACEEFGYITIYKLDKYDKKEEKMMSTGIAVEFLSEEDVEKLKSGMKLVGKSELNEFLQDFE